MQIFDVSTAILINILLGFLSVGVEAVFPDYVEPLEEGEEPWEHPPMVLTNLGPIQGTRIMHIRRHVDAYYGIPYAKPPIGDLRFKKPVPLDEPWEEVFTADEMAPACIQYHSDVPYPWADHMPNHSEDCLYLNIWVPTEESTCPHGRPVLFWIHSGNFKIGSSRLPVYDGRALANIGSVIVVTLNYRLGPLGFLYSETPEATGNAGLYDILQALRWVNENIYAFGGNSNRITIMGDDAGAIAVGLLTISPAADGLYRRAIMHSGAPSYFTPTNLTHNLQMSEQFARSVHCVDKTYTFRKHAKSVMKCLRDLDLETILKATNHDFTKFYLPILPAYGDEMFPKDPRKAVMNGDFHKTELLIGCNKDEGSVDLVGRFPSLFGVTGEDALEINKTHGISLLKNVFGTFPDAEPVAQYYLGELNDNDYEEIRKQLFTAIGDFLVVCPTVYFAQQFAKKHGDVYFYYFTHRPEVSVWENWMGVPRFAEVPYVFGQPLVQPHFYTEEDVPLSRRMIKRWTLFAKTGNPGGLWPTFSETYPKVRVFNPEMKVNTQMPNFDNCEFFKSFYEK